MAKEAPYINGEPVDEYFKMLVDGSKIDMQQNDDDKLFLSVGLTGSGKSMLTYHFIDRYHDGNINIYNVVIGREKFADTLRRIKNQVVAGQTGLSLWFDEADSDNMEQNAKWNKKLFALYMKIRYLKILHMWCWPSLKSVDRRFVEERVNGVFFCYTKEKFNPRSYAYFPKSSILRMMDDDIRLNVHNLKKSIAKYALWTGKFKDYNGPTKAQYLLMKSTQGSDAVDEFANEFAKVSPKETKVNNLEPSEGYYTSRQGTLMLDISEGAFSKRERELRRMKVITSPPARYTKQDLDSIANYIEIAKEHRQKQSKKGNIVSGWNPNPASDINSRAEKIPTPIGNKDDNIINNSIGIIPTSVPKGAG